MRPGRQLDIDLESGLAKLTPRQRAALLMHAEGLTYEEIGQELFITVEQVRYACSQGVERLRLALAEPE